MIDDYKSWSQVAAYFDGDGCVSVRKLSRGIPFTLSVSLEFVDQSRIQIERIKHFLETRHVRTGSTALRGGTWRVAVDKVEHATILPQRMLPHLCKKHDEVKAALDYMRGRITGNEFQDRLEEQVRVGNREKLGRRIDLPRTRGEGLRRAISFATSFAGRRSVLSREKEDELVRRYSMGGISQRSLATEAGLSHDVVRRALSRHGLAAER